ncbi:MAG TPA: ABC transporter ATP-binding protein [Acholeplasmataceae bacterium]|jgi:zinc transport system ATP-binding protein|nr:ABC transporter ATP-binding protein [Acholeplasmataceae bacterium]
MILEAKNLTVTYGQTTVLNNVSFTVKPGDYLNIIGPNGSGKTTLVKLLINLIKPTNGELTFGSFRFGYLPQHLKSAVNMPATVYEVLKYSNKTTSTNKKIDELLHQMHIFEKKFKRMNQLSGGEQQRVHIIRALLSEPSVLVLDEPTSALDPEFRKLFYQHIEDLNKNGMTIIHVTHDLSDGLRHGSKILELDQSVRFFGTFEQYQLLKHKGEHKHV